MANSPVDFLLIPQVELVEPTLNRSIHFLEELALLLLQAQHLRAEHWCEGKGGNGGNRHDDTHHPSELFEEHTRHTTDHCQREEHGNHGERRGNNRYCHLVRSVNGCLLRRRPSLNVGGDVFEHHNGIIHNVTDGNGQTRQGNHVERTACSIKINERGDERHWDGDGDDERSTPAAQEDEHDEHHENQGIDNRFGECVNRVENVLRGVDHHLQIHVRRQVLLQSWNHVDDLVRDSHGVGTTLLLDDDNGTLLTIGVSLLRTFLHVIHNTSHVAQIDSSTIVAAHNHVVHFAWVVELTFCTHRVGQRTNIYRTTRRVQVLSGNGLSHLSSAQLVRLHLLRVHVDIDFALRSTRNRHGTHSVDTCQRVGNVIVENLVESLLAFLCLHREQHDRNHVRGELEEDRRVGIGRQGVAHHVELVAHVVGEVVDVVAKFKFHSDNAHVLSRVRRDVLEVLHRVERILKRTRHVVFYIFCRRTVVVCEDENGVRLHIWIEVDWQFQQREQAKDDDCQEAKACHNRSFDRAFV